MHLISSQNKNIIPAGAIKSFLESELLTVAIMGKLFCSSDN